MSHLPFLYIHTVVKHVIFQPYLFLGPYCLLFDLSVGRSAFSVMDQLHEEENKNILVENLRKNMSQVDVARTFLCIIGGVGAGVLGYTGWRGLICFITVYLSVAGALTLKMKGNTKLYVNTGFLSLVTSDLQKNALSFVLFWTLTYALVYIY